MRVTIAILLILGLSLLLSFVLMNSKETARVRLLLPPEKEYPVSVVVLVSLVTGVLFASVIGLIEGFRLRLQNHQLRSRIKRMEAELRGLRSVPLSAQGDDEIVDEESAL